MNKKQYEIDELYQDIEWLCDHDMLEQEAVQFIESLLERAPTKKALEYIQRVI